MEDNNLALRAEALEVHRRLVEVYGEREQKQNDPIATLVLTIISPTPSPRWS